jgi:hypothetical protein
MKPSTLQLCLSGSTVLVVSLVLSLAQPILAADPATQSSSYESLVSQYMDGKWADLENDLKASARQTVALTPSQRADVEYIRQTLSECRPPWWMRCKAGKRTQIRQTIFNVPVVALYDPLQKGSMNVRFSENTRDFTLGWASADMDSPAPAEHGFTRGELNGASIWSTLGMSGAYAQVPFSGLMNLSMADKIKLTRDLDFRGSVAAAYYGNPRTRRWWFFLALHYYRPQYAPSPVVMSRRALGAMFVAEVLAHRAQYSSIKLPDTVDPKNAEQQLVMAVHNIIEKRAWSFAEDRLIRSATRAFAIANQSVILTGGPVKLANGTQVSLDPKMDADLQIKRDAWLVEALAR